MTAALKIEPPQPEAEEEGVELSPDEEEWFDEMIRETDEQIRLGKVVPAEEVLARFRAA
jgi:hypothetical protein